MAPRATALTALLLLPTVAFLSCSNPTPVGNTSPGDDQAELKQSIARLNATVEQLDQRVRELDIRTTALGRELSEARSQSPVVPLEVTPEPSTGHAETAEAAPKPFTIRSISLGLLTGAADWDGKPGDDGVIVYLHPLDRTGDTIKQIGSCTFQLLDLGRPDNFVVMTWQVPAAETVQHWQSFPRGYRFQLGWKGAPPKTTEPLLKATFTTPSGAEFSATKKLTIRLASE